MADQLAESHHAHDGDDVHVHVGALSTYLWVLGALALGTALTVAAAYVDMGPLNNVVALAIAFTKATLVLTFFMHLKGGPRMPKLIAVSSFFWLFIMFVITLSDYMTRGWTNTGIH